MASGRLLALWVIVLTWCANCGQIALAECKGCGESDTLCGPRCLVAVCEKLGASITLDEAKSLSGYDEGRGTSLLGLQSALKAKGLKAIGVKIGVDELALYGGNAIIHLWGDHLVLSSPGDSETVMVTDPPAGPIVVKKADLSKAYSGFAVLVAADDKVFPSPQTDGPDLRFANYTWDFGVADESDQLEYRAKCRNVGNADLVISKVETSCSDCLLPLDGPQTIPPGGEGEIRVMVMTANQHRTIAKTIYVSSNDPITPTIHLSVTGYVRPAQLFYSPRVINFGMLRRSESATVDIYVPSFREDNIEVRSVSSNSPGVCATFARSTLADRPGYVITATLRPGAPVGGFRAAITVVTNHPNQPTVEIPVAASIRGNVDTDRDSVFFGLVKKGEERKVSFTISTVGKTPLRVCKANSSLACVSVEVAPKTVGKDYILTAILKPDAPPGNIEGTVSFFTDDPDQPEIKLPAHAYVSP